MIDVNITKEWNEFQLDASFQFKKGVLGILGPSGCGKSLTLQAIAGLQTPDHGTITLNGQTLFDAKSKVNVKPKDRNIGYVFQNYALFPHLTVAKNIGFGLKKVNKRERLRRVDEMLTKMQLDGYGNHYPSELSGGQQQRVALARTLITEPELLLLDEPFSALDQHVKHALEQELVSLLKKNFDGIVLLVTHNIEEAYRLCDTIVIYENGKTVQVGEKQEILERPATLTGARLIGCDNIFKINTLSEEQHELVVQVNQLLIRTSKTELAPTHLGIHAHKLKLTDQRDEERNQFSCTLETVIEGINRTTIHVNCHGTTMTVDVEKEQANLLLQSNELYLTIPSDSVFYISKESP
ncbi:sulfate/molybdate ABC transporter ATP-binding protein [Desertibacillus haloalkaliphilus]|uniref:sulfate/molybdate ABC transporter ATP-binding protein n=1 Tax=Desertibacillus haloalkaliphilus TaxID=1328930 RepID=UPI001C281403|nr:sulfate/molybdate ABC transporter ATP-binding protein [Desertibacillus haloalkaliphilus]MBU8905035.1 sulfate/molybdate ABC transporter ATP-binding protein [Desertibacillus haloalkaliphilus]